MSAKPCDSCKLAKSLLFCRADSAFLCMNCDSTIHSRTKSQPHERVWLCDLCEQAPATVTCRADAAVLCVTCDRDIHSANPLAVRHERVPVVPFYESPASGVKFNAGNILAIDEDKAGEDETDTWLLPHAKVEEAPELKMTGEIFFSDVDPYFEMDYVPSIDVGFQGKSSAGSDGVVPVQSQTSSVPHPPCSVAEFFIDFSGSKPVPQAPFNYSTQSLSHSVSSSSLDVGVVPERIDITTGPTVIATTPAVQLTGLDREARVLRYKEKRKNRKFEKTIRYASRKAYAETRPRIKGRFVKRTETESEVIDGLYSSPISFMADSMGYGVVPTF